MTRKLKYLVDIDNTICVTVDSDYGSSSPITRRIRQLNELYDKGHTIVYFTARGSTSGIDWRDLTKAQLDSWGCKYHDLILGKPSCDVIIDDKACHPDDFFTPFRL